MIQFVCVRWEASRKSIFSYFHLMEIISSLANHIIQDSVSFCLTRSLLRSVKSKVEDSVRPRVFILQLTSFSYPFNSRFYRLIYIRIRMNNKCGGQNWIDMYIFQSYTFHSTSHHSKFIKPRSKTDINRIYFDIINFMKIENYLQCFQHWYIVQ